jgi:predicted AAA+ superfamily ATPase
MARASTKPTKGTTVLEFDQEAIKRREKEVARETDQQILDRLGERFEILTEMTKAVKSGTVRAMIVSGPPGVGKSYGVEQVLQKDGLFDILGERKPKFEVVKGAMSSIGLYAKLYEFSEEKNVIVFDDCDSILMEDLSLEHPQGCPGQLKQASDPMEH